MCVCFTRPQQLSDVCWSVHHVGPHRNISTVWLTAVKFAVETLIFPRWWIVILTLTLVILGLFLLRHHQFKRRICLIVGVAVDCCWTVNELILLMLFNICWADPLTMFAYATYLLIGLLKQMCKRIIGKCIDTSSKTLFSYYILNPLFMLSLSTKHLSAPRLIIPRSAFLRGWHRPLHISWGWH